MLIIDNILKWYRKQDKLVVGSVVSCLICVVIAVILFTIALIVSGLPAP